MNLVKVGAFWAVVVLGGCMALPAINVGGTSGTFDPYAAPAGYERFLSPAQHNFRWSFAFAEEPVRRGSRAERYELRDGDCGGSDCGKPRYRAELQMTENPVKTRLGDDVWYGWSFRNKTIPQFRRKDSLRIVLSQWYSGTGTRPLVRLIQLGQDEGNWKNCNPWICTGPSKSSGDIVVQLAEVAEEKNWGTAENDGYICRLFDSQDAKTQWQDIVMSTNFSSGSDGYLKIWVNDVLKCDYQGPIASRKSMAANATPQLRRGIFSSYTLRWDKRYGSRTKPTLIAYYDEFQVGRQRRDVDVRMQERYKRFPVD